MNGVSWLRLSPLSAQLLFGKNIFTLSGLHVLLSALIYCVCCFLCGAPHFCCFQSFCCLLQHSSKATWRAKAASDSSLHSVNLLVPLPDWSRRAGIYCARRSRHNVRLNRGGFISSWRRRPVNVLELPASFESALIHFGCKPSATVLLVFSQASERNSCIFSAALTKSFPPQPPLFSLQQYILRGILWNQPSKKCGD